MGNFLAMVSCLDGGWLQAKSFDWSGLDWGQVRGRGERRALKTKKAHLSVRLFSYCVWCRHQESNRDLLIKTNGHWKNQHPTVFARYLGVFAFHICSRCGHFVDAAGYMGLPIPSILCTVCNALLLYPARAGPVPELVCTWTGLCTFSRRRARRREADK